ncbi:family 1 glycosylhydrolase, partial [Streptococcus pneumoniae]
GTFLGYYSEDTLFHLNQILEANNSSFIIEDGDLEIMKRAAALNTMFGMNYYRSEFIREYKGENRQEFNSTGIKGQSSFKLNALGEFVKKPGIPTTDWDWNIYPQGLFDMLLRIKEEYPQHPVIYLTENGTALKEVKPEGENDIIDDSKRIRYIEQHLHKVLEAR